MTAITGRPAIDLVVLLAAGLGALLFIARSTVKGVRIVVRFFQRIDKVVTNVEAQLYPNGGASLRDAVNRIQQQLGIENVTHDEHSGGQP